MTTDHRPILTFGYQSKYRLPGERPRNRRRPTKAWGLVFFALGVLTGWLAHMFQ